MNCTWVDCSKEAAHPHAGQDGKQWCNLCAEHHDMLESAFVDSNPKKVLSYWVKAQGGAKKVTESMKPEIEKTTEVLKKLSSSGKFKANSKIDTSNW